MGDREKEEDREREKEREQKKWKVRNGLLSFKRGCGQVSSDCRLRRRLRQRARAREGSVLIDTNL